jgi:small redox-active disulfide protein 2
LRIQVLGTGCPKCRETLARVRQAADDLGVDAEIEKVEKIQDIMAFGIVATPAVAVDGVVKVAGRLATVDEIKEILKSGD